MRIRGMFLSLLFTLFMFSCSKPYLFISDSSFGEMEGAGIEEFSSRPIVFEVFSKKPSPLEILEAAGDKNAEALVFSPLYYDLAESVHREDPGVSVYAVVPPGHRTPAGIRAVELSTRGAADAIITLLESQFPADDAVHITLIRFTDETLWNSMTRKLTLENGRFRFSQLQVPVERVKQRDFGTGTAAATDVLLLFLGEYSPGIAQDPAPDSRGKLPKMIISDRPVDSGGNIRSWTLAVDWGKVYRSLLEGSQEAAPWFLVSDRVSQ